MPRVAEYGRQARAALPRSTWDYIAGGAGEALTVAANRAALRRTRLRPRVLVDVATRDTRTTLLGHPVAAPIAVAPMAYHCLAHPEGEAATARAVGAHGLALTVSTFASCALEEVAAAATAPLWFQLYCFRDRSITAGLLRRAEAAGYAAVVLTADMPVMARRGRDPDNGFVLPEGVVAANLADRNRGGASGTPPRPPTAASIAERSRMLVDPSLTWDILAWMRQVTTLPVVVKGILTAEDAALAVAHGAQAVMVSNHGGRQLDGAVATLDALPEVADAVGDRCEVYVDGGIRRGVDVLKALALGARATFVGRPVLWGLAVDGAAGVASVLRTLCEELDEAMALCGCPDLVAIGRDLVRRVPS